VPTYYAAVHLELSLTFNPLGGKLLHRLHLSWKTFTPIFYFYRPFCYWVSSTAHDGQTDRQTDGRTGGI